jgi:hypothetical protein
MTLSDLLHALTVGTLVLAGCGIVGAVVRGLVWWWEWVGRKEAKG